MGQRTILCSYCNKPLSIQTEDNLKKINCPKCNKETKIPTVSSSITELDFYALEKPYSYVSILKEEESLHKYYVVLEPVLSDDTVEILSFLKEKIVTTLDTRLDELEDKAESYLEKAVEDILDNYDISIDEIVWEKILYYLKKRFLGYDNIDTLMKDPYIEDISCDGANVALFIYQRRYGSLETNIVFSDEKTLSKFVVKLAQKCGKHISVSDPMLDATMPDGSRIQMTLSGEITTRGSTFTIRKFRADPITPVDLVDYKTFSMKMIAYLWMAVEHGFNALISGGTASGKTSALNALALFVPRESKIVSIEETREINLPHPNWIPGITRSGFGEVVNDRMVGEIDLFDLMKAALRQRPEYILVGEIRGKEAYVLFQAMATGHTTYSTVHADSMQALIHRLEGKPINIPRTMLQSLDLVLIMRTQKTQEKNQRRCIKIVELLNVDNETNEVLTNSVFEWDPQEGEFTYSGKSYIVEQIRTQMDLSTDEMTQELRQRADILSWMRTYHIREFTDVTNILAKYADTPEKVLKMIKKEPEKIDEEIKDTLSISDQEIESLLDDNFIKKRKKKMNQTKRKKKPKRNILPSLFSATKTIKNHPLEKNGNLKQQSSQKNDVKKKITKQNIFKTNRKKISFGNQHPKKNQPKKNPMLYFTTKNEKLLSNQKNLDNPISQVEKEIDESFFLNTSSSTEDEKPISQSKGKSSSSKQRKNQKKTNKKKRSKLKKIRLRVNKKKIKNILKK